MAILAKDARGRAEDGLCPAGSKGLEDQVGLDDQRREVRGKPRLSQSKAFGLPFQR
jgi:hypothetical protein